MEFSKITDNIYIGSNLCVGPTCPIHSVEFKKLGICGEVNLEVERDEHPTPGVDTYVWLPVKDEAAPTMDQLMIGTAAMKQMIELGNIVYVHCKNGHGRAPTLVAAYFVRYQGMTPEQAVQCIAEKRKEIHLTESQKKMLEDFSYDYSRHS